VPRRFPIVQFPNRPLIVAALAGAAARWLEGKVGHAPSRHRRQAALARLISRLALLVWALEEVLDGANWFRRLLGVAGGGHAIWRLRCERGWGADLPLDVRLGGERRHPGDARPRPAPGGPG